MNGKWYKWFKIIMPNGYKKTLFYDKEQDKNVILKEEVLKYWETYLYEHWIWQKAFNPFKYNFEDITKALLDRCGTFLLLGNFKNGMCISPEEENEIKSKEIPLISTSNHIQNLVSEVDSEHEYSGGSNGCNTILSNEVILSNDEDTTKRKVYKRSKTKKYTNMASKVTKLYRADDKIVVEFYKIKNKDVYTNCIDNTLSEEEQKVWFNKNFKNIHGDNVYDYRKKVIKGNPEGIIDRNKSYVSKWCYVDTKNIFEFDDRKYKIDNIKQYEVLGDNISLMDSVLYIKQDEKEYFYDMNIEDITSYVKQINCGMDGNNGI